MHALLLSLPGSPCLYCGDEIGMGDNIWLNDRDAVRTPMQWTPDRNAGFSTADPGKLYLPVIQSLVHHFSNTNVEAQLAQPTSLLHWVHGMLAVRRLHPALGTGDFTPATCDNSAVLALPAWAGASLTDVFGGAAFPSVSADGTVTITLGSRDFYWLTISRTEVTP